MSFNYLKCGAVEAKTCIDCHRGSIPQLCAGETFPVKTVAAAGFSEGAMALLPPSSELRNRHILSRWRPWGPAQPSRLGIVTARLLGDHLGPEVSREPSLSGFNAPWALIITTYHIGHYCVVRTAKKMGP